MNFLNEDSFYSENREQLFQTIERGSFNIFKLVSYKSLLSTEAGRKAEKPNSFMQRAAVHLK